jgi:hypothetical protein
MPCVQRSLMRPACAFPRAQELINPASISDGGEPNPLGTKLQQVVRKRYKGLTLEQNVCVQLLLPLVRGAPSICLPRRSQLIVALPASQDRGSDRLMVTALALEDSRRSVLVEAFAQLLGLPVHTCKLLSPLNGVKAALALHIIHHTTTGLRLLIPDPGDVEGLAAPDSGLRRLLPIVGTPLACK